MRREVWTGALVAVLLIFAWLTDWWRPSRRMMAGVSTDAGCAGRWERVSFDTQVGMDDQVQQRCVVWPSVFSLYVCVTGAFAPTLDMVDEYGTHRSRTNEPVKARDLEDAAWGRATFTRASRQVRASGPTVESGDLIETGVTCYPRSCQRGCVQQQDGAVYIPGMAAPAPIVAPWMDDQRPTALVPTVIDMEAAKLLSQMGFDLFLYGGGLMCEEWSPPMCLGAVRRPDGPTCRQAWGKTKAACVSTSPNGCR